MMFFLLGRNVPGRAPRRRCRAAHLDYVAGKQALIVYAGPLLDDGKMVGSLFVFEVPDRAALDAYLADDPYFRDGVFSSVDIWESRWMVPEREEGLLKAEAERAKAAQ